MLQRTTQPGGRLLTPPMSQPENPAAGQVAPAQTASWLRYYLILIALVSVIACTFIWQANDTQNIRHETNSLGYEAERLEEENSRLMVELALLDSPANIEREAARLGIAIEQAPRVTVTPAYFVLEPVDQAQPLCGHPGTGRRLGASPRPARAARGRRTTEHPIGVLSAFIRRRQATRTPDE